MLCFVFLSSLFLPAVTSYEQCFDCIGSNCQDKHCHGDYCVMANYTAKFGLNLTEQPQVIKGCASGSMLESDIREHCEIHNTEHGKQNSMCICNSRECNTAHYLNGLNTEIVKTFTCNCSGAHCGGETSCRGEMCTWAKNHRSGVIERGCLNSTFPLLERRAIGSCMIPPMTDSLSLSVAKNINDLLVTESCICAKDYCNKGIPRIPWYIKERERCTPNVNFTLDGNTTTSRALFCVGEYCFKASLRSEIGLLQAHSTTGCLSFLPDSARAEELQATGCVRFESEKLNIEACFMTRDKEALERAQKAASAAQQNITALNEAESSVSEEVSQETTFTLTTTTHNVHANDLEASEDQSRVTVTTLAVLLVVSFLAVVIWKWKLHQRLFGSTHNTVSASYRKRFVPLS